ncbi:MAG: SAM-dependent methyltransferase [Symbiobacteriaceae bacterium]|jgi:putative AdoMet-dependent methyltransferase|nr:SAM-dependent methyltransferase [Symbiobacteriaceae bacterium]
MGLGHSDFMAMFDQWAPTYDATVFQAEPADGFERYQEVLARVAELAGAAPGRTVLDVGTGTGNLAQVLADRGATVLAVEPSAAMRQEARQKLGDAVPVLEGQFLDLPVPAGGVDAVVSSYAFHHLTDDAKVQGAKEMLRVLRPGGVVVLGDIAWADEAARQAMIRRFKAAGKPDLVQEIEEEYYPTIGLLTSIFASLGCSVYVEQWTDWVWVIAARKR